MNSVFWFEMPAEDLARASAFYTKAFGWEMKDLGPAMNHYTTAMTTENDANGMPKKVGAINGGFFQKTKDMPMQYPSVVIHVPDVQAHMKLVEEAGGKILGEPMDIPGVGTYVSFVDSEGNRGSMMTPNPTMK
jgi:predicted enzyme related to lactoylglutathione lyase